MILIFSVISVAWLILNENNLKITQKPRTKLRFHIDSIKTQYHFPRKNNIALSFPPSSSPAVRNPKFTRPSGPRVPTKTSFCYTARRKKNERVYIGVGQTHVKKCDARARDGQIKTNKSARKKE